MSEIKSDEHVFICGMTGCGKTYFAERYLACYDYVIKFDTKGESIAKQKKGEEVWSGLIENIDYTIVRHLSDIPNVETKKVIYCPEADEMNEQYYNEFFRYCYERENTIVWIDELMSISSANSSPEYLKHISIMGRSRNVSLWCCSQRPSGIPQVLIANCSHFIVYKMQNDIDRKKMCDVTGFPELRQKPEEKYSFWYVNDRMEKPSLLIMKKGVTSNGKIRRNRA